MGSIIREDTEGEPSAALTETGKGGLLSQGYLRDAPAREYVGAGETPVFVLTDDEVGVERVRGDERTEIKPGKGYRSITVVTDRRLVVLVGNAEDGGDKRVTLPLVEIADAHAADGTLVVAMNSGVTWRCHVGTTGIGDVAAYVAAAADAWRDVESTLDSVKRTLVDATGQRDDGAYEAALATMRDARDDIEAVEERTASFTAEWPGDALVDRVEKVRDRCLGTAAEIRVGFARARVDDGEEHWREGEYERARECFEEAREAYEAVQSLAPRHRDDIDDVDRAVERVERTMERLDDAPLRAAIDADQRAREMDPCLDALDALAEARDRYEAVLELDPDDGERQFAVDRDRIREQREDVTDRFVETALAVGTDALDAGQWCCDTGQTEYAEEEFERAIAATTRGLAVAETERPAHVEELRGKRSSARDRLADVRDDADGDDQPPVDGHPSADQPDDGPEVPNGTGTDGSTDADRAATPKDRGANEAGTEPVAGGEVAPATGIETGNAAAADGGVTPVAVQRETTALAPDPSRSSLPPASDERDAGDVVAALRDLPPERFADVVTAVVEAMGWRPRETASAACDYIAERDAGAGPTLAIRTIPNEASATVDAATIEECADLASSVPTVDGVMVATTRPLADEALEVARARRIRLVDAAYLADALRGPAAEPRLD